MKYLAKLFDYRWWIGLKPKFATMPPKDYKITVLIPAYNEEKSIAETIRSIQNQTVPIEDILVIDDHSSDKTGEISRALGTRVIRTNTNQGTKAQAQSYVLTRGEVKTELVVTIDGDTILDKHAIEKTLPYFNNPNTASVCGFVIPAKIKTIWERGRFVEYIFGISLGKAAQNNVSAVLVSSGCFSVFRTELIEKMGGFKARTMAEDMDLTWDFAFHGYNIYCVQDAYCYPYDPSTFKIFINQIDRWYRSYFQNIAIHKKSMKKNLKLSAFIYGYLLEGLFAPIVIIWGFSFITKNFPMAMIYAFAFNVGIVSIVTLTKSIALGRFSQTLTSIPAYFILCPINFYIFWQSMIKEWILKTPLTTWNKGH